MLAVLIGVALAAVPSVLTYTVPEQTVRDAGEHARPVVAAILVAPLVPSMLVAASKDWLGGNGSPLLVLRQLAGVVVVVGAFVGAVGGMQQPDFLTVVGGFLLIGFATGLGIAFTTSKTSTYTDTSLAIVGWGVCMVILLAQVVVSVVTYQQPPTTTGRYGGAVVAEAFAHLICCAAIANAVIVAFTTVALGGIVGGWLRRGYR